MLNNNLSRRGLIRVSFILRIEIVSKDIEHKSVISLSQKQQQIVQSLK